jgi:hypothetical protein
MTKDEVIETKAAWGKTFVEIIDPTKENHVFRAYFEQPQREWVGLTDEQKKIAIWTDGTFGAGALWAEAKLKDKNNG